MVRDRLADGIQDVVSSILISSAIRKQKGLRRCVIPFFLFTDVHLGF